MDKYKIIQVKESVFADNDREADRVRQQLKKQGTFLLNLMSSPGSGKTTTLLRTVEGLKDQLRMGVMEADIDSDVDAAAMANAGVRSIQLHTGGMCHLDAGMTQQGLRELGTDDLDLVVLENVGNLVCPAEFDTGAVKNAMILSVPEGHDKPLKYPLIFTVCDALIINKIDVIPFSRPPSPPAATDARHPRPGRTWRRWGKSSTWDCAGERTPPPCPYRSRNTAARRSC